MFAKAPVCAMAITNEDFVRRRNLWFAITLTAFLAHDFWMYIIVAGFLLRWASVREENQLALYFFLLFAVPMIRVPIETHGLGFDYLIEVHYVRLMALVVLLPTWWKLRQRNDIQRFGKYVTDKILLLYIALAFTSGFWTTTLTDALRNGVYLFIDIFLPYYVASRAVRDLVQFRDALASFVAAGMVLALLGVFEMTRNWLVYAPLDEALGVGLDLSPYLMRGETLRAMASTGQPIVLGYVMCVALGLYYFLWRSVPSPWRALGILLLVGGTIAPVSRGPWVGAMALALVLVATSEQALKRLVTAGIVGGILGAMLLASPVGGTIVDHLPFIGTVDAENVEYRRRLIEQALIVIGNHPLFGTPDAIHTPEMQQMQQAGWIIDIVNSYVQQALEKGLVGLSLFVGLFLSAIVYVRAGMRHIHNKESDYYRLAQSLLATLVAILVTIGTVSSIGVIPTIYWAVAGMGVAYARISSCHQVSGGPG
jgi:O-antigen ligase